MCNSHKRDENSNVRKFVLKSLLQGCSRGRLGAHNSGIAIGRPRYYLSRMSVLTCKLPSALDGRLADLAKRRGVAKSVLVREAIEAKIAEEAASPRRRPANLLEALGDSVGSIASGKRDLASNKKHLRGFGK